MSMSDDLWVDDINDKSILRLYDQECDGLLIYAESGALIEDEMLGWLIGDIISNCPFPF